MFITIGTIGPAKTVRTEHSRTVQDNGVVILTQRVHGLWSVMAGSSPSVLVSKSVFISVTWDVGVEYRPKVLKTVLVTLIHSRNLVI